jgi:hypothetical protein
MLIGAFSRADVGIDNRREGLTELTERHQRLVELSAVEPRFNFRMKPLAEAP